MTYGQSVSEEERHDGAQAPAPAGSSGEAVSALPSRRPPVRQGSAEWLEARRSLITATDIPVLLGLSPYKSEATLAREKAGEPGAESNVRMRIGTALEPLILDEYERATGRTCRRFRGLINHPDLTWAAASPDARVVGERRLVELKWSGSRGRWADGLPQDVEAQVAWQMGVCGYPAADVAALLGDELRIYSVEHDPALWERLVLIAEDFRARLAFGGPMAENAASIKAAYPSDNGAEMTADSDLTTAVTALRTVRSHRKALQDDEERIETAIKGRMGECASLVGPGFRVTWKRTKDREETDWRSVADGLLRQLPETERAALVGIHTAVRAGFRPFRVVFEEDTDDDDGASAGQARTGAPQGDRVRQARP